MTYRRIDWKDMMRFIKSLELNPIPQSLFYREVHLAHPLWEIEQIAKCLRSMKEGGHIDIGLNLEIIPLFLSNDRWDILEQHSEEQEGKWIGKGARTCPECHSTDIKNVMHNQAKCMECGLIRIRRIFSNKEET